MKQLAVITTLMATSLVASGGSVSRQGRGSAPPPIHPPFKRLWAAPVRDQLQQSIVAGSTIYYRTNWAYGALDLATGKSLWQSPFANSINGSSIAYDGRTLYVAMRGQKLLACATGTGQVIWSLLISPDVGQT